MPVDCLGRPTPVPEIDLAKLRQTNAKEKTKKWTKEESLCRNWAIDLVTQGNSGLKNTLWKKEGRKSTWGAKEEKGNGRFNVVQIFLKRAAAGKICSPRR